MPSPAKAGRDAATAKVSVIVPLFNAAPYIEETVQRVLDQSHRDLEVIIVDDGSTDRSVDIVRRLVGDARVSLILKPHVGIARTRNTGLAWSDPTAEYVLFLDQDDTVAPDLLEGLIATLSRRPDAVGAYAMADFIDSSGRALHVGGFASAMRIRHGLIGKSLASLGPESDVRWPELFLSNPLYPPSAILLRKTDVLAIGGFDSSYEVADDWDLLIRLLRRGPLIAWDDIKVGYRRHDLNASSNVRRNVRETRAVWANTYYSDANSTDDRNLLRRYWRASQRVAALRKRREAGALLRNRHVGAALVRASDATAHLLLVRPLRSWRTRVDPGIALARSGVRDGAS
jgi:glycosyltransferase involved in cell wall biosynthesis